MHSKRCGACERTITWQGGTEPPYCPECAQAVEILDVEQHVLTCPVCGSGQEVYLYGGDTPGVLICAGCASDVRRLAEHIPGSIEVTPECEAPLMRAMELVAGYDDPMLAAHRLVDAGKWLVDQCDLGGKR